VSSAAACARHWAAERRHPSPRPAARVRAHGREAVGGADRARRGRGCMHAPRWTPPGRRRSFVRSFDKIRLLGFTTLHDSRRYTIPRCLGPSHPDTKARCAVMIPLDDPNAQAAVWAAEEKESTLPLLTDRRASFTEFRVQSCVLHATVRSERCGSGTQAYATAKFEPGAWSWAQMTSGSGAPKRV